MTTPFASIVMPVFNRAPFLHEAIKSLMIQTFDDFELIIVDDHSFDNSMDVIRSFSDPRINVVKNTYHLGQYPSRNRGHKMARGKYLFVMDSDDVAEPRRLEEQIRYMEDNPEVGLVGSNCRVMPQGQESKLSYTYEKIKIGLITQTLNYFHPSICLRREWIDKYELYYNEHYIYSSDLDLVMRSSRYFPVVNLDTVLLNYFNHKNSITSQYAYLQTFIAKGIVDDFLSVIDIYPTRKESDIHFRLRWSGKFEKSQRKEVEVWIDKVLRKNKKAGFFDPYLLSETLYNKMSIVF